MKLLFDQNLSRRLVRLLADMFPGSTHVALESLDTASDRQVWDFARQRRLHFVDGIAEPLTRALRRDGHDVTRVTDGRRALAAALNAG